VKASYILFSNILYQLFLVFGLLYFIPLVESWITAMKNALEIKFMVAFVYQSGNVSLSIYGEDRPSKNMTS